MNLMFDECSGLKDVFEKKIKRRRNKTNLEDISEKKNNNVINMNCMFFDSIALDVSREETNNVTNMSDRLRNNTNVYNNFSIPQNDLTLQNADGFIKLFHLSCSIQ
jgi:hypothetical protein